MESQKSGKGKTKDFSDDATVTEWLNSQKPSTKRIYRTMWAKFSEFTNMTGDQIIADRKADKEYAWEKRVLAFKAHLQEKGLASYGATTAAMAIRGFFSFHRVPLQYRKTESKRLGQRARKTEDYRFTLEDFRKLYEIGNLPQRYIITAGKSFGLRAGDFLRLTYGDLQPVIDKEPPISIGPLNTEKESVKAYPFIDSDAKPIIKLMLEKMAREGRTSPKDKILRYRETIQLSRVLKSIVTKAGIQTGGRQVRFHCLRKFLADHLSSFMSESKWKMILGKMVAESAYISPDDLAKDYARAMSEITFTRSALQEDRVRELAREELKATLTPEQKELIAKSGLRLRKTKNVSAPKDGEKCEDGEHCGEGDENFEQISETDLLAHLRDGWQIAYKLSDGQVIVKRE